MIVENHWNDPGYLESRAIELIQEAKMTVSATETTTGIQMEQYHDKMGKAMGLLALARCARNK